MHAPSNREGATIGLYFLDPYMRPTKNYGAWMNNFRDQQRLDGEVLPIVVNVWNYNKPEAGQPTLLSWDDAENRLPRIRARFAWPHVKHDLRHTLGTNVARDYVEFPSQVMERWFSTDEICRASPSMPRLASRCRLS
ncbi:MAG: M3 family metallopeptidase [Terricaulis sp.]